MTTFARHGGEAHVVRPDRVYRTSVLTPIVGYQPQMDVQAVARAFTQGPPLGTQLQGLGYYGFHGLQGNGWDNFKSRMRNFFARFRFNREVAKAANNGAQVTLSTTSPGPASMEAAVVAPQMQSQMAMLAHLTQGSNSRHARGPLAAAMFALQNRRPFTYYRAG
jgi:hypothetical protein